MTPKPAKRAQSLPPHVIPESREQQSRETRQAWQVGKTDFPSERCLLLSPGWPQVHDVDQAMKNLNTRASASQVLELLICPVILGLTGTSGGLILEDSVV